MTRHLLSQNDLSRSDLSWILDRAGELRERPISSLLSGRSMVMFFEKTSTRTRLSFEIGMTQLGGHAVYFDRESSQLSRGESIRDTAEVLSRYADFVMARVQSHETVAELARYASVPVINGLSDREHPTQTTSDLFTIRDHLGRLEGVNVAYIGDASNNVAHSLLLACSRVGANIRVASPFQLRPDPLVVEAAKSNASASGSHVVTYEDPAKAASGADVIYTDVWVSMGQESQRDWRIAQLRPYQINRVTPSRRKF